MILGAYHTGLRHQQAEILRFWIYSFCNDAQVDTRFKCTAQSSSEWQSELVALAEEILMLQKESLGFKACLTT